MNKIIKLCAIFLILATVTLSTTSCGFLTAGLFESILGEGDGDGELSAEEEFYQLVYDTKLLIDRVSLSVSDNWHSAVYENGFNGDINQAISEAKQNEEAAILTIEQNSQRISELYRQLRDDYSDILYNAQEVMTAYNAYYSSALETDGKSYDFYTSTTQSTMLELSVALRNYNTEL